jgi:predicted aspartyl protease
MITGTVKSDEARIRLKVIGRHGREQEVDVIIDSGFNGALTLPPALIAALDLRWRSVDQATLADGSTCVFQVHVGKLAWDGKVRSILVAEADADPLVGMRL